ncbi:MAG: protein TolR [Sterolibacterium sp.]
MNQINVVPYIDVMLVLLIIFMVTAPMIQTGSINLPSVGNSSQPATAPLEVVIHADASLALRDRNKGGNELAVGRADLADRIREAQSKSPQQAVLIAADKSVRYELVLDVMDELKRSQVEKIGLLVQPGKQAGK